MTVRYFAAARAAAGVGEEIVVAGSVGDVLEQVRSRRGARFAAVLGASSLLVDGLRVGDVRAPLGRDVALDVLPPFAGG